MLLPQSLATVATAAAATAVVVLSGASVANNVYETYALVRQRRAHLQLPNPASSQSVLQAQRWASVDEAVKGLSGMAKRELMELFLHCEAPELSDLAICDGKEGMRMVYDGTLLENGAILTPVTNFITNRLFGRGRPWLGKAYNTCQAGDWERIDLQCDAQSQRQGSRWIERSATPLAPPR